MDIIDFAELRYKINGAVIDTALTYKEKIIEQLQANAQSKLKKPTGKFDRLAKDGVTVNLQDIKLDSTAKLSILGSHKNKTQALRIFTGSGEQERLRKSDGRRTGVITKNNPFDELMKQIETDLQTRINEKLKQIDNGK